VLINLPHHALLSSRAEHRFAKRALGDYTTFIKPGLGSGAGKDIH
jgi:hypothetical protein